MESLSWRLRKEEDILKQAWKIDTKKYVRLLNTDDPDSRSWSNDNIDDGNTVVPPGTIGEVLAQHGSVYKVLWQGIPTITRPVVVNVANVEVVGAKRSSQEVGETIFSTYNTIYLDVDNTLLNCYDSRGNLINSAQLVSPFKLVDIETFVDVQGNLCILQSGVRDVLKYLDGEEKNIGIISSSEKEDAVFEAQPVVQILKKFNLYRYFNARVIVKKDINKVEYAQPNGKTLFVAADAGQLQQIDAGGYVDVLNRASFENWSALMPQKKVSWKISFPKEFTDLLDSIGYSYHIGNGTLIIDHEGYVSLYNLTTLPNNIHFNNKGSVHLNSLATLPNNVQFNNEGNVFLHNLTTLPDKVQFNNRGNVYLNSLLILPYNREQVFKNYGYRVGYNRENGSWVVSSRVEESRLSWKSSDFIILKKGAVEVPVVPIFKNTREALEFGKTCENSKIIEALQDQRTKLLEESRILGNRDARVNLMVQAQFLREAVEEFYKFREDR